MSRDKKQKLIGYQRGQVKRHVADIVDYLNSEDVIFPNSLILALSSRATFCADENERAETICAGHLEIPLPIDGEPKPAWIVDGQQRAMALAKSERMDLPVPVNAFIADDISIQREQFLRVNNTRPLPRGLVTELLPEISGPLPSRLASKRIPSLLCEYLSQLPASPFFGLIRRASSSPEERKQAVVAEASIIHMIEESISSPSGCLFAHQNIATSEFDLDGASSVLLTYWKAVKKTFPRAWGRPATESRLMHGAGIRAMGRLMDRIMSNIDPFAARAVENTCRELRAVAPHCSWIDGRWDGLGLRWDELQNLPGHIRALSDHLIRSYVEARGTSA